MKSMRRGIGAGVLAALVLLLPAAPARAQEEDRPAQGVDEMAVESFEYGYRYAVGVFAGQASGGNPVLTVQNPFFNSTFQTGSSTAWGIRATLPVWWRLAGELEFLRSSPGIDVILTDPSGADRSELPFAELDMTMMSASARFDLADALINPFLLGGLSVTSFSGEDDDSDLSLGIVFGGGIEIPIPLDRAEGFFARVDVRGLRAHVSAANLPAAMVEGDTGSPLSTQVTWTLGAGYRF